MVLIIHNFFRRDFFSIFILFSKRKYTFRIYEIPPVFLLGKIAAGVDAGHFYLQNLCFHLPNVQHH